MRNQARHTVLSGSLLATFDAAKITGIFAPLDRCDRPGAVVGIAIGGRAVFRKGFGLANLELPVVMSPSIRMRINSTTKHFACLAYLLLCEQGAAKIDDRLGEYFPELHPVTHNVTMRQLMTNTSGLRDVFEISWMFSGTGRPVSTADLASFYRGIDDVNFAPGSTWCYCNGGFLLLSLAIERITGQTLEEVLRERIFEPVGLHDTLLRRFDTDFVPNSAALHTTNAAGGYEKSYFGTASTAEGGVVSTVDDMLRWLAHMDRPAIGSENTWFLLKTPQVLENGVPTGYGLGLMRGRYRGFEVLHHSGVGMGANSQMLKVPAAGLDVVIMVNSLDVSAQELANKVLDASLNGLEPVREARGSPFAKGVFRSPATGRVLQLDESPPNHRWLKGGRQIASLDGFDVPVDGDEEGILRPVDTLDYKTTGIELSGDKKEPTSVRVHEFGAVDEFIRLTKCTAGEADIRPFSASFRSETTGTTAIVADSANGPTIRTAGRFGTADFTLEPLAAGIWRARGIGIIPWSGIVSFDDDGRTLSFSTPRNRALPFRRCA